LTAVSAVPIPTPSRIRLRVGVSGHRVPPKLPANAEAPLRAQIDRILAAVLAAARAAGIERVTPGEFVIVSSLAEGSDRIVAEAGLAAGFGLQAILPFSRTEYAQDFKSPKSREVFDRLLDQASAILEMDGAADKRPRAYEATGFLMLENIDLLIAVWDGEAAAGRGGTAQIVNRAVADGIAVVWLDPASPNAIRLSWREAGEGPSAQPQLRDNFRPAEVADVAHAVKTILSRPAQ
jgi:hypothetical protein